MTLADKLFEANRQRMLLEEQVGDILDRALGCGAWSDFDYDYYDRSIEIYGVTDGATMTGGAQEELRDAGFARAWTHVGDQRRQSGERYYRLVAEAVP